MIPKKKLTSLTMHWLFLLGIGSTLITNVITVQCNMKNILEESKLESSWSKCVSVASSFLFEKQESILLILRSTTWKNDLGNSILAQLHKRYSLLTITQSEQNTRTTRSSKFNYSGPIKNYIVEVNNENDTTEIIWELKKSSLWNPQGKILIIFHNYIQQISDLSRNLWSQNIFNLIISADRTDSNLYLFHNSYKGNCLNEKLNYPKNPSSKMHTVIRVQAVIWPPFVLPPENKTMKTNSERQFSHGIEVILINTIAKVSNFSVTYTTSSKPQDWGLIDTKMETFTGALLNLKNNQTDIAIGSFPVFVETYKYFDSIIYNIRGKLTWCVPYQNVLSKANVFLVMQQDIWILLLTLDFVVSFCVWSLGLLNKRESTSYKTFSSSLQNVVAVLLHVSVKIQPKTLSVRAIFIVWVFFVFHVNLAFQSALFGLLTNPKYVQIITTTNDILQNNLKLWILPNTKQYFQNNSDATSSRIIEKWEDCNDAISCINKTTTYKDSALCMPYLYMRYFIINYYENKTRKEPPLYCFKEAIVTFPLQMMLRKDFPLKVHFEKMISRITEAGLISKWEKDIFRYHWKASSNDDMPVITMSHLKFLFSRTVTMWILGILAFLGEICFYRRSSKKNYQEKQNKE